MERHPLDLVSLTAGLIFTVAAVIGLTGAISLGLDDLRWIGPALLVLFGVVLVATSVSKRDDHASEAPAGSADSASSAGSAGSAGSAPPATAASSAGSASSPPASETGTASPPPSDDSSATR